MSILNNILKNNYRLICEIKPAHKKNETAKRRPVFHNKKSEVKNFSDSLNTLLCRHHEITRIPFGKRENLTII